MNKARIAVLATLTLSVLNLCFMILSVLTKTRVFPDYPPIVITLFTVFLITLVVLSIWQLFAGLDGQTMRGKILQLLAVEYFVVYVADIANIFPRSVEPMGQTLFIMEMLGTGLAVLLFISASGYIKSAPTHKSM
ncbi:MULTISPECIES: hypothetical protein [Psychrobacter]|uniref:DUF8051 domain-containing protein n=1 Tax=Psychrobacter alimentarius TaxID=261164 RepID=A0ABM6A109_9GAMM|nr:MULTISPECIES: hypothetical protein [Psychrobacter]AMT98049.1 hypothetical protein A3K91_2477 [Psychrobacter alimentarius]QCB29681.1 hypothetical protein E5677_01040 [Psychrobacter sp. PAMC27889]